MTSSPSLKLVHLLQTLPQTLLPTPFRQPNTPFPTLNSALHFSSLILVFIFISYSSAEILDFESSVPTSKEPSIRTLNVPNYNTKGLTRQGMPPRTTLDLSRRHPSSNKPPSHFYNSFPKIKKSKLSDRRMTKSFRTKSVFQNGRKFLLFPTYRNPSRHLLGVPHLSEELIPFVNDLIDDQSFAYSDPELLFIDDILFDDNIQSASSHADDTDSDTLPDFHEFSSDNAVQPLVSNVSINFVQQQIATSGNDSFSKTSIDIFPTVDTFVPTTDITIFEHSNSKQFDRNFNSNGNTSLRTQFQDSTPALVTHMLRISRVSSKDLHKLSQSHKLKYSGPNMFSSEHDADLPTVVSPINSSDRVVLEHTTTNTPSVSELFSSKPSTKLDFVTESYRTISEEDMTSASMLEEVTPVALPVSSANVASVKRNLGRNNQSSHKGTTVNTSTGDLSNSLVRKAVSSLDLVSGSNLQRTSNEVVPSKTNVAVSDESASNQETSRDKISILGLFEMTTRLGERLEGRSELAAARLAEKHINERNILPGYQLDLHTNDTKCDPGVGVDAFFHALYTQNATRMVMLLGTACSDVTESLAKVVPYWNIVQVSFGSTSPALSDRREFPLFYRTVAPDSSHNPARLAFVRGFGWDTVTALSQNEDVYSLAVNDLVTEFEQANITCRATITFAESDFKDQLRMLRDLDTRIIIGSFSHEVAPKIFCEAFHLGMYGSDYAWILQGSPNAVWWRNVTECPQHQLAAAVEGLLLVSSHNSIVGAIPATSGLTNTKFLEEFESLSLPVTKYAPQTYDAVWAIALALRGAHHKWIQRGGREVMSVKQFDYNRRDMALEFLEQLGQLTFLGVSGPVSFSGADRVGISAFYQVQDGEVSKVALFYPSTGHLDFACPDCHPLVWQGGQVPIAKRVFKLRVVTIEPAAFLSITCLASIGITLAIAFLAFNLHFRKLKYIKLSSPRLNNMAVVGCILVYTAVILLGLDHATLPANTHFPAVCTARVYLLSAGFSLAFGSMFTKTYRVHRIFTRSRSGVVKNKLLQDTQLISLICVLLLIDGLIVTLWVIIDPIQRHLRNLTLEISASDRSVVYQPQVEVCRSQYTHGWLGALYVYKGLLLIVGVYMAWETRHVKIPALNDSQYIGMSVYSVVITSGIVVVLANLISERATLAFVTITTLILTSTTATLCLLFLPKLHAILGHMDNGDPIIHSMGLKIECNTRRFVMDDRRELYYRVEVQNRVYRREMAALDLEIGRLKRQLIESPTCSSGSVSSMGEAARRAEFSPVEERIFSKHLGEEMRPPPGIGGGLPMLLLSVLPPVIPRASWPSADHGALPMRRQVTFCSEPKLDESSSKQSGANDDEEYYTINRDEDTGLTEDTNKLGVLGRLFSFLGSRPSSRKTSTASFTGNASGGIASALRVHMGYLAGLVPSTSNTTSAMVSSCNTSTIAINQYGLRGEPYVAASSRELHPLKKYCGRVGGGSGPIISVTSNDDNGDNIIFDGEGINSANRRKFSLAMCLSRKDEKDMAEGERRVSYSSSQRLTIQHQHSQPILPFRERARGSPRFPHKIVPTCSLNALEDRRKSSSSAGGGSCGANPSTTNYSHFIRRRSSQHHLHVRSRSAANYENLMMTDKCRSLEDAASFVTVGGEARSSSHATPSTSNWKPRAASYSPNCDVWATAEFGIPLSELANSSRGREKNTQQKDTQCS